MPPRKDPFAGDDNEDAANRRAVEKVRQARTEDLEERKAPRAEDDDEEEIEIGAEPDDDDDDDGEEREPNGRPSRSERRRQRGDDLLRAERERADRLEKLIADQTQVLGRFAQPQPRQEPPPGPDPLDQEAETLRGAQEGLQARFVQAQQSKAGPEAIKALQKEAWELKDKIDANSYKRMQKAHGPKTEGQPMTAEAVRSTMIQEEARQRFGDVLGDQRSAMYFQGEYQRRRGLGEPDSWDTMEAAAAETRRAFRMRPAGRTAPTAGEKRRFSGQSRGAGSAQAERSGPKTIVMTRDLKRMADAAYPHIKDAKKRYQKWANGPGAKLVSAGKV